MNNPLDPSLRELTDCGCCAGTQARTPRALDNRPSLSAVAFRAGTHADFRASMLAALSSQDRPGLQGLRTRDSDDFSVALLDAWSAVADVLTFYSERIAQESYLRTATERRSVLELARSIGYELKPGVAASTVLAFTLDDAPGAPGYASIPVGTRVQSLPGPGEKPQTFETTEAIEARQEWNSLQARSTRPQLLSAGKREMLLEGTHTGLHPGDAILIVGDERDASPASERWDFRILQTVSPDPEQGRTRIAWQKPLGWRRGTDRQVAPAAQNVVVFAFRQRAALFGHNAPDWRTMPEVVRRAFNGPGYANDQNWKGFNIPDDATEIDLDVIYPRVVVGGWLVLDRPGYTELYKLTSVNTAARVDFALTAKTSRVGLDGSEHLSWFGLRNTVVYCQTEELTVSRVPVTEPVQGDQIALDRVVPELEVGRKLIVSGQPRARYVVTAGVEALSFEPDLASAAETVKAGDRFDLIEPVVALPDGTVWWHVTNAAGVAGNLRTKPGNLALAAAAATAEFGELVVLRKAELATDGPNTVLHLETALKHTYDPATVRLRGNIATATHGESMEDILGSGDASAPHQGFVLKQTPLTHVPQSTGSGGRSTLQVWVNDVQWQEVPTLFNRGPEERVFVTRLNESGYATVRFGDGQNGARLPSGSENLRATYRKGGGLAGEVKAGRLTLMMNRPLGVKSVTNPFAATGASDPQALDQARANAPRAVLTLDRVVSLRDYEDLAADYTGVAKALATWVWIGESRGVLVSVLGDRDADLPPAGVTVVDLPKALRLLGDEHIPIAVQPGRRVRFGIAGTVEVRPEYEADRVDAAMREALAAHFAFERRDFGQGVPLSEVIAVLQAVDGVESVDIDGLTGEDDVLRNYLPAYRPGEGSLATEAKPAEVLVCEADALPLLQVKAP